MNNIRAYDENQMWSFFCVTDFFYHFVLLIAFDGFWEFWFFSVGLSALELGVGLACLDLRGSRDFLPFGSGLSKIIVLGLIYTLGVATEMSHLRGH